jgi:hypothetical protein
MLFSHQKSRFILQNACPIASSDCWSRKPYSKAKEAWLERPRPKPRQSFERSAKSTSALALLFFILVALWVLPTLPSAALSRLLVLLIWLLLPATTLLATLTGILILAMSALILILIHFKVLLGDYSLEATHEKQLSFRKSYLIHSNVDRFGTSRPRSKSVH